MNIFRPERKLDRDGISPHRILQYILVDLGVERNIFNSKGKLEIGILYRTLYIYLSLKYTNQNRLKIATTAKIGRNTLYNLINFNPTRNKLILDLESGFLKKFPGLNPVDNWQDRIYFK